jgi:hypothetical protein
MATVSVITVGVIAWFAIQRPLLQPPPFSFIPISDDLIHWQFELKEEEMPGTAGSCRIYSFPADFNSICLRADAELSSQDYMRFSMTRIEEFRQYVCKERVSDTGSAFSVRIVNNRISDKRRADSRHSERLGWVTVEVTDVTLTLPVPQSLVDELNKLPVPQSLGDELNKRIDPNHEM